MKTLYGKDTKGGIKQWSVEVVGNEVHVTHGKLNGKMQTKVTVCEGKNIGRANETTPQEQAISEAQSKYKKQMDKLYRPTIEELSEVGNSLPMLAHDYTKVGHRLQYPCHVSPKLDGVRALCHIVDGTVTFTSRGGKEYKVPDHILEALKPLAETGNFVLDGELYLHGMSLQNIVSAVKNEGNPDHYRMQYHVFDVPSNEAWRLRYYKLLELYTQFPLESPIKFVQGSVVESEDVARGWLAHYMGAGFEGLMLRSLEGVYAYNHRSPDLMKWKEFVDCEAKVTDVREDKNGEGVLTCQLPDGITFSVKMRGNHEYRKFENQSRLVGSWITVRYQQLTDDGVPQFPVGICVRECDDQGTPLE